MFSATLCSKNAQRMRNNGRSLAVLMRVSDKSGMLQYARKRSQAHGMTVLLNTLLLRTSLSARFLSLRMRDHILFYLLRDASRSAVT